MAQRLSRSVRREFLKGHRKRSLAKIKFRRRVCENIGGFAANRSVEPASLLSYQGPNQMIFERADAARRE